MTAVCLETQEAAWMAVRKADKMDVQMAESRESNLAEKMEVV